MGKQWKRLDKPYHLYSVSSDGEFKSRHGNLITTSANNKGKELFVGLTDNCNRKPVRLKAKELVASKFCEGYGEGMCVRSIDGNPSNIAASNLQFYNPKEESEDPSLPNKKQLLQALTRNISVCNLADELNISEYMLRRLLSNYEISLIDVPNELRSVSPPVTLTEEEWEVLYDTYEVSNFGNVRLFNSGLYLTRKKDMAIPRVTLVIDGHTESVNLAKLVAELFVLNPNCYNNIVFIDGDANNCRADNLVWVADKEVVKVDRDTSYYSEAPQHIRDMLMAIYRFGLNEYSRRNNSSVSCIRNSLRRFGFPTTLNTIRREIAEHRAAGTLEYYLTGVTNIKRVELNEGEAIKSIEGFPGFYITSHGRVISHKVFTCEKLITLKQYYGYVSVSLSDGTSKRTRMVHSLVANAFLHNPNNLTRVTHKDGDLLNCHVDNLVWVTDKEFSRERYGTGKYVRKSEELQTT